MLDMKPINKKIFNIYILIKSIFYFFIQRPIMILKLKFNIMCLNFKEYYNINKYSYIKPQKYNIINNSTSSFKVVRDDSKKYHEREQTTYSKPIESLKIDVLMDAKLQQEYYYRIKNGESRESIKKDFLSRQGQKV